MNEYWQPVRYAVWGSMAPVRCTYTIGVCNHWACANRRRQKKGRVSQSLLFFLSGFLFFLQSTVTWLVTSKLHTRLTRASDIFLAHCEFACSNQTTSRSMAVDPAFTSAGTSPGMEIWRIEVTTYSYISLCSCTYLPLIGGPGLDR